MSRRALTLLLGGLLALGLTLAGAVQTVPYVALTPGPAFNTLGKVDGSSVLTITGRPTYPTTGALDLTTVSLQDHITLFEAVRGWLSSSEAVIPREVVFPPNQTSQQTEKDNLREMSQSHDDATTAALRQLGFPFAVTVQAVKAAPAQGRLAVGDRITSVDGRPVKDAISLSTLVSSRSPGQPVVIGYTRAGKAATVTLTTASAQDSEKSPDSDGSQQAHGSKPRAVIGVTLDEAPVGVKVDIELKDVGGPSAGLMFALGIIDKLGPESLTAGRTIAGTGTIDGSGTVGEIGGIAQKMRGAKARGATVFLSPAGNCSDAKANKPGGLTLVKVSTLQGALDALATLRAGGTPPGC